MAIIGGIPYFQTNPFASECETSSKGRYSRYSSLDCWPQHVSARTYLQLSTLQNYWQPKSMVSDRKWPGICVSIAILPYHFSCWPIPTTSITCTLNHQFACFFFFCFQFFGLLIQWIGFVGKNLHRKPSLFSHEDHGAFRWKFSLKPIHWLMLWAMYLA